MDWIILIAAAAVTALATGLGALPVWLVRERAERFNAAMWGFAGGTMFAASVIGLFEPAFEEGPALVVIAAGLVGVIFMLSTRNLVGRFGPSGSTKEADNARRSATVFIVLLVHSFPEGLAIGAAYASDTAGLGLFIIVAIAIHNIPEGVAISMPMATAGKSHSQQFWASVGSSLPQPIAAPIAYAAVILVEGLLPPAFAFAGGAMVALVVVELLPESWQERNRRGEAVAGVAGGIALMIVLAMLFGAQ